MNPQLNSGDADDWKRPAHAKSMCSGIKLRASAIGAWPNPPFVIPSEVDESLICSNMSQKCLGPARHDKRKLNM